MTESAQTPGGPTPSNNQPSRPEWLPEKFSSPEDLAKAYGELESKLGSNRGPAIGEPSGEQAPSSTPGDSPLESLVDEATTAFLDKGEIPADILTKFKDAGISPQYVQELVEGRKAKADGYTKSLYETVGGEDKWKEIASWAAENLPQEDRVAFNAAIQSGDPSIARLALYGVQAKYNEAARDPRNDLSLPGGQSGKTGPAGYRSQAELQKDMMDSRYYNDESFRQSVLLRMKATAPSILQNL